jgi:hypothetical protein
MTLSTITKRNMMFLLGCIPVRILLAYIARTQITWLPIMAIPTFLISTGFLTIWFFGLRETGAEVFGGEIWWNDLRPVHAMLYMLFSVFAIYRSTDAWKFLAADVVLGLGAFLRNRLGESII